MRAGGGTNLLFRVVMVLGRFLRVGVGILVIEELRLGFGVSRLVIGDWC